MKSKKTKDYCEPNKIYVMAALYDYFEPNIFLTPLDFWCLSLRL